jgi:hypothetical protein
MNPLNKSNDRNSSAGRSDFAAWRLRSALLCVIRGLNQRFPAAKNLHQRLPSRDIKVILRFRRFMPDSSPSRPGIWAAIAAAFRQNRLPCLFINALVIALVASYYHWPAMAGLWQSVGDFKTQWSFLFSLGSTILSAAIVPFVVQWAMHTLPAGGRMRRLACLAIFWGYRGMEIDLLYRIQGFLFGHGNDARTLIIKVAVDQFVYSTFWAVPTYVIALRWIDLGGSWSRTRASLDGYFWKHTCPTVLFTNWIIWIPTVALVYSLPAPLQFPVFSVVMCFFILLVTLLARGHVPTATS